MNHPLRARIHWLVFCSPTVWLDIIIAAACLKEAWYYLAYPAHLPLQTANGLLPGSGSWAGAGFLLLGVLTQTAILIRGVRGGLAYALLMTLVSAAWSVQAVIVWRDMQASLMPLPQLVIYVQMAVMSLYSSFRSAARAALERRGWL